MINTIVQTACITTAFAGVSQRSWTLHTAAGQRPSRAMAKKIRGPVIKFELAAPNVEQSTPTATSFATTPPHHESPLNSALHIVEATVLRVSCVTAPLAAPSSTPAMTSIGNTE